MVKVVITHPGDVVVDEFDAFVEQPTLPPTAEPPTIGLVQIATSQPTDSGAEILAKLLNVDGAGSGLDADLLDGQHGAYYLPAASYTAPDVLAKLITVDGSGSGLDADLLDGQDSAFYLARANHTGTQIWSTITGTPTTLAGYGITDVYDKTTADARFVNVSGDTMTGPITLAADPAAAMQAATKQYVDAKPAGAVISDTPPSSPSQGQTWWESDTGNFYISYNDGSSTQWVMVNAAGIPDAPNDGSFYGRLSGGWSIGATKTYIDNADAAKVAGPAASTDNALARFDLATGKVIQNSGAILDDSNNLSGIATGTFGNVITTSVSQSVLNSSLALLGGSLANNGARISLLGPSHATAPSFFYADAAQHTFRNAAGGTNLLTIDGTGTAIATGNMQALAGNFLGTAAAVVLCPASSGGAAYLRPNGGGSTSNEVVVTGAGAFTINASPIWSGLNCPANGSANGYQKFANGIIIQWGQSVNGAVGDYVVNFPITFPNFCIVILANAVGSPPAGTLYAATTQIVSGSSFNMRMRTQTGATTAAANNVQQYWIAIGV